MVDAAPYQLKIINAILQKYVPYCEVRVFGSRVTWTAKDYSDLDLAIVSKKRLAGKILYALKEDFEESDLPFRVDVLDWNSISDEFRNIINKGYEVLQKKGNKFRQTEIGKIPGEWDICLFSSAVAVNPLRKLKKGIIAKKVSMQNLLENQRKINGYEVSEFKGGTKFKNNDTLMARITPCLENGKTAYVDILDNDEIGFGSTEFNILCGKDRKTTDKFVYYLATSPVVRAEVIKSMVGTSGRQRAQSDVFNNILISLPTIEEQKAIAKILSDLDEKIELNQQMNKTLEAIGQASFKRWFVDFEFPNEKGKPYKSSGGEMADSELGEIPKGWKTGKLGEIIENFDSKRIPLSNREREKRQGQYPYYGATSIMDYIDDYIFDGKYILMGEDGTVVNGKGYPVLQYVWGKFWANNHTHILGGKKGVLLEFIFLLLKNTNVAHIVTGAVQPKINQGNMNNVEIVIPNKRILSQFNNIISPIFASYRRSIEEIKTLSQIRDSLLPRLISGKMKVR